MSQPGPKPAASPRPRRGAAARHTQEHVNEKNTGSSSKSGEKKRSDESCTVSTFVADTGDPTTLLLTEEVPASSAAASKFPGMSTTEAKAIPVCKQMEGPHLPDKKRHRKQAVKTESEKSQSSKPSVGHEKKSQERKPKEGSEPQNLPKHASDTGSKHAHKEKAVSRSNEKMVSEKSAEPKTKSQDAPAAGGGVVAGVTVAAASDKAEDKKKEKKSLTPASPLESKLSKPSGKSGIDVALDDLIDTLGEPEETNKDDPRYTGPIVLDPMDSTYIEALGIKEGTIPPEYRELLAKKEGITVPPSDSKPMGPDDAIDALSSDFTCSSPPGKQIKKEKSTGDVFKAQAAGVTRSPVPPQEKKRKVEEDVMSDQALQALSDSLGTRQPDPESHLSQAEQVKEAKAKEERQEKCGEDDDTVPAEYRLKPAVDKDGKPLLPEPEEKSKRLSEAELIGQLSEDFGRSTCQDKPSIPAEKIEKSKDTSPTPVAEAVPRASMCSIQSAPPKPASSKSMAPDDAVETLAGSLGKKEANPEDEKPVVDKVKEKAKEKDYEKLGEKEETIPPDYKLEEVKDKDGKPLLAKEPKEQLPPLSDDFLLDALSQDFCSTTNIPSLHRDKELSDALDELSDRLGERQPDPDENKPVDDKVKEKIKAEHREKLGERDDTIPPEYRHLLDNDGQGKPEKPPTKKSKKPDHDQDPIDALSEDLDSCPSTTETSQNTAKEKSKKMGSSSKAPKNGVKTKDSSKKTEVSNPKADEKES
ncbi:calpastatin isoform X8 [Peromyscus californicus insignis]|uniref:calpastatin isoform X8 n=1 Tax=Peromyscus californicus insignis TaxID=564181 RepID=UPI0022A6BF96|nr:calpastatin isoform X8 [Peromyscus californicus insignis]